VRDRVGEVGGDRVLGDRKWVDGRKKERER
jgi:hypothetical protein